MCEIGEANRTKDLLFALGRTTSRASGPPTLGGAVRDSGAAPWVDLVLFGWE